MKNENDFSILHKTDFDISDIFAMRQVWRKGSVFTMDRPRRNNGIIFLNNCYGKYTDINGNVSVAQKKSIVFLPKGSRYSVLNVDCEQNEDDAILIEFNLTQNNEDILIGSSPFILTTRARYEEEKTIDEIAKLYESSLRSICGIKGKIYSLIAMLSAFTNNDDKFKSIRRGIEMLESNLYDNISIEDVARECNVSSAHFRRLFCQYAQKSPIQFRLGLKLEYAKNTLLNSDLSIEEIAALFNFESSAYFCRIFKKKIGLTPSEYRKQNL